MKGLAMGNMGKCVTLGIVLSLAHPVWADAAGDYQGLFGEEENAATAKGAKGAPEFAAKLLDAAKSAGGQKDLQALLCEKAYQFGTKAPAGYSAAAEAMKLLIGAGGDNKAAAQDKLLKVSELRFAKSAKDDRKQAGQELVDLLVSCGDERAEAKQPAEAAALYRRALTVATSVQSDRAQQIADKIKGLAAAQEGLKKIADLRARLERDPKNTVAREGLILAYLGELDDPNEAAKLVTPDVSEGLRTYVPLAAKKVEDLAEAVCLDLAEWYVAIAEKASPAGKGVLLGRAQACCERFLELHQAEDAGRIKGKMLLAKVDKAIQAAGGQAREITLTLAKGVTMKLVLVPAGKFTMGSPDSEAGRRSDEGPQHVVTISKPFYVGMTEVTQAQYAAVMGVNPSKFKGPDNPVEQVCWLEAVEFCGKLSRAAKKTVRLPTEAEWEYACRSGKQTAYCYGDDPGKLGDYAWFEGNSYRKPHPVGQKKPNRAGLFDIYGNVWEWCSDWYAPSYANAKALGPTGPGSGTDRVMRGGCCGHMPPICRSACRDRGAPIGRNFDIGFRVVVAAAGGD
jgi:formylglycine-generating enzyme required for sulfatase activity